MQYTETQLSKLIEDVEKEFTAHLAKSEDTSVTLAKAEDNPKPEEKKPEAKPKLKQNQLNRSRKLRQSR
jgi:hypothetical protein